MSYSTAQIRNVALAGHPGAGKTTLFEALLHAGGALQAAGSVERGTTVSDFDPMEKSRVHSLNTAIASTDHGGIHVNLIDTPGFPDFRGPTLSAFSAVETVCVVVNASQGVEYGTRRMMEAARARDLCRVIVVNKIDVEPGKLSGIMGDAAKGIARTLGCEATFMAKPFQGNAGSGMHVHMSVNGADGANIFATEDAEGTPALRHAIGGMAATMDQAMAVLAPNANSYRRYVAHSYAPTAPTWGVNNRTVSLRIPVSAATSRRVVLGRRRWASLMPGG